jgi:hypothetical protein
MTFGFLEELDVWKRAMWSGTHSKPIALKWVHYGVTFVLQGACQAAFPSHTS